jgi:2'-5' RNA ligase
MKRLFCAVKIPPTEAIEEVIGVFSQELGSAQIKWVATQNLHLTLKFFGDTPNHQLGPITEALFMAASDFPPFSFTVEGCGTFGSVRQPNVIWLGIKNAQPLIDLYNLINQHLAPLGYVPDKKLFTPHLTIGRIKSLPDTLRLRSLESEYCEEGFARVKTSSFYLMESFLRPQGPLYKVVEAFRLGEGHRA